MRKTMLMVALLAGGALACHKADAQSESGSANTGSTAQNPSSGASGAETTTTTPSTTQGTSTQGTATTPGSTTQSGSTMNTPASGTTQSAATTAGTGTIPPEMFTTEMALNKIHAVNQEEINAAKVAKTNGDKTAQKFAERMTKDHTKADKMVMDLAKKKNVTLQDPMAANFPQAEKDKMQQHMTMMEQMKSQKGPEFDKSYLTMMVNGHEEAVNYLTQAEQNVQDKDVKGLIKKLTPEIKDHLKTAKNDLQKLEKNTKVQGRR